MGAIETSCDAIIPSFCFGEKWIHESYNLPRWLRAWLYKTLRVSGVILRGRGLTFLGFLGHPLGYVWGEPIPLKPRGPKEIFNKEDHIKRIHGEVKAAVLSIFERHKTRFGYPEEEKLEFVSVSKARKKE